MRLQAIDRRLGTDLSPKGTVAYNPDEMIKGVNNLISAGCEVMIKADLSVDGMGNVHIDQNEEVEGYGRGVTFDHLNNEQIVSTLVDRGRVLFLCC